MANQETFKTCHGIELEERKEEEASSFRTEIEEYEDREQLPLLRDPNDRPGVWTILKSAVGKDITKMTMPVYMNEPLSMI